MIYAIRVPGNNCAVSGSKRACFSKVVGDDTDKTGDNSQLIVGIGVKAIAYSLSLPAISMSRQAGTRRRFAKGWRRF